MLPHIPSGQDLHSGEKMDRSMRPNAKKSTTIILGQQNKCQVQQSSDIKTKVGH